MTTPAPSGAGGTERPAAAVRLDPARARTIVPGVALCPLVDARQGAENLFAGVLTVDPKARHPYYTRPCAEVLTLLKGVAAVDVEDRRYRLQALDHIALPRGLPRRVVNLSTGEPVAFHVAMAASTPLQTWVNARFDAQERPLDSTGREHAEQIGRKDQAAGWELAPRALFQEFHGGEPNGWDLHGGIGWFEAGARLPCYRVEGDEAVTVVEGAATCVIEGSRHELTKDATILIPRGRCRYLINLTLDPLVLIWANAGGSAGRIIVEERFCHPERKGASDQPHP